MILGLIILAGLAAPWDWISDVGNWAVVVFGLLLCVICLFSLFALGMRAMSTDRYKPVKHNRGKEAR